MIEIYDEKFTYDQKVRFLQFAQNSLFRPLGSDAGIHGAEVQMFSHFSDEDNKALGIVNHPFFAELTDKYSLHKRKIKQSRINLTTPAEKNRIHTDGVGITLLYYLNVEWDIEWGGHTLIMDKDCKEVEKTILYVPGRLVVFDGVLPHMIMTPSNLCPTARYTYAIQYGPLQ